MKTLVIVGAGTGLGLSIAKKFGAEGFRVATISRNAAKLKVIQEELSNLNIETKTYIADITDLEALKQSIQTIKIEFGSIDVIEFSPYAKEDKYDLIDYVMEGFATVSIENYISENMIFNEENISQLILAVHDFYQEPNIECRSSYAGLALPQMREKMLNELTNVLTISLKGVYEDNKKEIFVPIFAQMVHEAALQLADSNDTIEKEALAKKIALFIVGRA